MREQTRQEMERIQRPGDRIRRRTMYVLERDCEACGTCFYVAPNRPDARYCRSNTCKMRRQRARASEGSRTHRVRGLA